MEPKKIFIEGKPQIHKWADENRSIIMECLYDNVFDFVKKNEDVRVVLKLVTGGEKPSRGRMKQNGYNIEFTISKDDIVETIDNLLTYMIETEEYEKCGELTDLKKMI